MTVADAATLPGDPQPPSGLPAERYGRSASTRARAAERTRERLLDAGLRLAERTGLASMSVNLLVAEADLSKGTFFHHFGDRAGYLLALHRGFHDRLLAEIEAARGSLPAGRERLLAGSTVYLDACLCARGVKALLLEARAESLIATEVMRRNEQTAKLCEPDFRAIGWQRPAESGRLWVAMVAEVALAELAAGRRQARIRRALEQFTDKC